MLFNNITEKTENELNQSVQLKEDRVKSYLIPKQGTAITEQAFIDAIKLKEQTKSDKNANKNSETKSKTSLITGSS